METIQFGQHIGYINNKPPFGARIWNIGDNAPAGYVPFVYSGGYDGCQVDIRRISLVANSGAEVIMDAIGYGPDDIPSMEQYIETHPGDYFADKMRKALPYMKELFGASR